MLNRNTRRPTVIEGARVPAIRDLSEYLRHSVETSEKSWFKDKDHVFRKDRTLGLSSKPK